mgnify:CR=1 FL=1
MPASLPTDTFVTKPALVNALDSRANARLGAPISIALATALMLPTAALAAPPDAAEAETAAPPAAPKPPRIDGGYYGGSLPFTFGYKRIQAFDTPAPFIGGGAGFRAGDAVFDWMTLGFEVDMLIGNSSLGQRETGGQLLIDFGFYPRPKTPWSIRTAFGFGAASVRDADGTPSGYGGAAFRVATRYEFFPRVMKYRPTKGGGFGIGPELGWAGATPAARGRPMANTFFVGLSSTFYFGS